MRVHMVRSLKNAVRKTLSANPVVFDWARQVYCSLGFGSRTERDFLFSLALKKKDIFFLEVGANDGVSGDPLHYFVRKHGWRGIALEPIPDVFEKLRHTYEHEKNVSPYCAALSDADGRMSFYRVQPGASIPSWCNLLGSFSKQTILSHKVSVPEIDRYIVECDVQTISFGTLVKQFDITKIDVIAIDTEGYDYEILKMIDFKSFRPSLVIWEQIHLDAETKLLSKALLQSFGYEVHNSYNMNFVGVRKRDSRKRQ
jgi:FkbM family methyltransferase